MGGEEECIIQMNDDEVMAVAGDWLMQTDNEVEELEGTCLRESERWRAASIYRIPRKLNSKAYQPQVVSIGPYHHGKVQLAAMEVRKHRALLNFLKRTGKRLEHYVRALNPEMRKLKAAYPELQPEYKKRHSYKFLKMMVVDGCFILELMGWRRYVDNDPIFSEHGFLYLQPLLRRDMLMLENQIPLLVLVKLQMAAKGGVPDETKTIKAILTSEIIKFFDPPTREQNLKDKSKSLEVQIERWGDFVHILDLYRKSLLFFGEYKKKQITLVVLVKTEGNGGDGGATKQPNVMRSATELTEAGIGFRKRETGYLNDMKLDRGSLKLPRVTVDATSQYTYLNLMAFERLHVGNGMGRPMNEVTSYVFFMDRLIDTAEDVALLHWHGIVDNFLGSDDDVVKLFNRLSADICADTGKVFELQKKVAGKYRKPGRRCLAYAKHKYFTNPWVTLTIVAGILIFFLTFAQTVYAILDYHKKK